MSVGTITQLLRRWAAGQADASQQLFTLIYPELKSLADRILHSRQNPQTLQRTALVHEVFLKLRGQDEVEWNDRVHFMSFVARMMRQILVDHARERLAKKRWEARSESH